MPPALDKTLVKDHRIHISSPILPRDVDFSRNIDPKIKLMDNSYAGFRLNLPPLSIIDSFSSKSSPELSEMSLESLVYNSDAYKTEVQSSLGSLLGCVSMDQSGIDCPVFLEASGFKEQTTVEKSRDVSKDRQNLMQTLSPLQYFQRKCEPLSLEGSTGLKTNNQGYALRPVWNPAFMTELQQEMNVRKMELTSQHSMLATRTDRAKLRLHALLGKNVLQDVSKQVEKMWRKLNPMPTKTKLDQLSSEERKCPNALGGHGESNYLPDHSSAQSGPAVQRTIATNCTKENNRSLSECVAVKKTFKSVQLIRDVHSLVQSGQAVLRDAQQALDSDATESSSDDDWEEETRGKRASLGCLGCEWSFQYERAKLASQWTWLKLRLSVLDLQIQHVSQLHQHLITNKGGVVLAKAQPLTNLQIQQTLLTETTDLTITAGHTHDLNSDLDTEPSSPTRLLRNIERQSAQLSQIVNSLMAPLSDSSLHFPEVKEDSRCWRGSRKRPFTSCGKATVLHTSSTYRIKTDHKKRRACYRDHILSKVDVTRVCARIRPLLTYNKPRLFVMDRLAVTQQEANSSASSCSVCCDSMRACLNSVSSRSTNGTVNTINGILRPNKSSQKVSQDVHTVFFKEDWLHQSSSISLSPSFTTAEKHATLFNCTHKIQAAQMHNERKPVPSVTCRRTVKRRHQCRADIDMCVFQSVCTQDSAEDMLTQQRKNRHHRKSQFTVRRRNGESIYNINNIVIPMSLAACATVEKLQYKDIPTPSWRAVEISPLALKEVEDIDEVESLLDEEYIQRHQRYECKEKHCWSSWEKGRRCTLGASTTDGSSDSEAVLWTRSTSKDSPQDNLKERGPQPPWERRVFPLSETDELALQSHEDALQAEDGLWTKNQEMESSLSDCSFLCYAPTPPPAGHKRNSKFRLTSPTHNNVTPLHYRRRSLRSRK